MVKNIPPQDIPSLRGIYHIHSNYSYDGHNRLADIAAWGKSLGLDFVLLTEHDLGFEQGKFEEYCAQCANNSGDVLLVPGIEYEVIHAGAKIHIGAIGVPVLIAQKTIRQGLMALITAIHSHGGLAVLHHPNHIKKVLTQKIMDKFDLVELWNTKFDCGFGPNLQFLRWLHGMKFKGSYLVSADIHDVSRFRHGNTAYIDMEIRGETLHVSTVIERLIHGQYRCRVGSWCVLPNGTYQVPGRLYQLLPFVCLIKKSIFRGAKFCVPKRYRKKLFNILN